MRQPTESVRDRWPLCTIDANRFKTESVELEEYFFVVESTNAEALRWISGILEPSRSSRCVSRFQCRAGAWTGRAVHSSVARDPVFLIEDRRLEWGDLDFVSSRLRDLTPIGDRDYVHMNVYVATQDFAPSAAGTDALGALLHGRFSLLHLHTLVPEMLREPR